MLFRNNCHHADLKNEAVELLERNSMHGYHSYCEIRVESKVSLKISIPPTSKQIMPEVKSVAIVKVVRDFLENLDG